jgi:hypothetical protein
MTENLSGGERSTVSCCAVRRRRAVGDRSRPPWSPPAIETNFANHVRKRASIFELSHSSGAAKTHSCRRTPNMAVERSRRGTATVELAVGQLTAVCCVHHHADVAAR